MSTHPEDVVGPLSSVLQDGRIDVTATRVYLALLGMPRPTRELLLGQGIPAATLDQALAVLDDRGLVTRGPSGGLEVPPPLMSMPQHALDLERRAQAVRAVAHELTQLYYNARARGQNSDADVMVLHELDEVASRTNLLVAGARRSLLTVRSMTQRTRDVLLSPVESHGDPSVGADGRNVGVRTVWDTAVLELAGAVATLAARAEGGEEQRFLARVPLTVIVVDHSACLLEWSSTEQDGPQGVLLRTTGMALAAAALVERLWELATPLGRGTTPSELEPRDETILRLMAAGVPDASIARQAGVSQRTVERRIRSLMDRLGAETRFQAGVQAVRHGWL